VKFVEGTAAVPVNDGILQRLAKVEAARMLNQFRDRISGITYIAGLFDVDLIGNMNSVTYAFTSMGLETIVDMSQRAFDPSLEQLMTQEDINYLRRHVKTADEVNHAN